MHKILTVGEYKETQFGNVVSSDIVAEDMYGFATIFSEGSIALKDLLLYLWRHGIETKACCTGHICKPIFKKRVLWFEKYISENEYLQNQNNKNYRYILVNQPGYLCFYYYSDNMRQIADSLRDMIVERCPDIPMHINFSYDNISIHLDKVLYMNDIDRFFNTVLEVFPIWISKNA